VRGSENQVNKPLYSQPAANTESGGVLVSGCRRIRSSPEAVDGIVTLGLQVKALLEHVLHRCHVIATQLSAFDDGLFLNGDFAQFRPGLHGHTFSVDDSGSAVSKSARQPRVLRAIRQLGPGIAPATAQ
jgi:hypothetical protein